MCWETRTKNSKNASSESFPRSVQIFFDLGKKIKHFPNESGQALYFRGSSWLGFMGRVRAEATASYKCPGGWPGHMLIPHHSLAGFSLFSLPSSPLFTEFPSFCVFFLGVFQATMIWQWLLCVVLVLPLAFWNKEVAHPSSKVNSGTHFSAQEITVAIDTPH